MNKKFLRFTLFLLINLTLPLTATAQVVNIPDPNLRAAIENAFGKAAGAPITVDQMTALTRLEAPNANISDLTGLEHATNLTGLWLGDKEVEGKGWINSNSIKDLSPLGKLTDLTWLNLSQNNISDISPLAELINLTWLDVGGNSLSNISPVAELANLTALRLWRNNIVDISPVAGLIHLTELNFHSNNISDLSPLVANTGLGNGDEIYVQGNPLSYQSVYTYISILQSRGVTVEFDRTPTALLNISGVITELDNLLIVEVRDSNGLPFEGVPVMFTVTSGSGTLSVTRTTTDENGRAESRLTLRSGGGTNTVRASVQGIFEPVIFSDVTVNIPDPNLRAAIENTLSKPPGTPIAPAEMAALTRLEAQNANISDLTGLEAAINLKSLWLDGQEIAQGTWSNSNAVSDLSPLAGLINLEGLDLWKNSVSDISPVAGLTNLTHLGLVGNAISDVSALAGLTNLESLFLDSNPISDLSALAGLTNLTRLGLDNISISDISALTELTNLRWMRLAWNNISDLSPLVANTGLGNGDEVDVRGNSLSYLSTHTHIPTLQGRGVTMEFDNRTPATLLTISGVITELDNLLIIEVRDSNGRVFEGVPVTFTVTSGSGTLSVTRTMTDENGRAESRLTLRSSGGTNTVRASIEGFSESVTFSNVAADIPDPNLRAAIEGALGKIPGTPIAPAEMAALTRLEAPNANINDLTGLEHATNLTVLELGPERVANEWRNSNAVNDLSPLAGLTQLERLHLPNNSVSDISPVAGLTNLTWLNLWGNSIWDISAVAGLTNLTGLYLGDNNISDLSPLVANTGLGSGDTVNMQRNPLSRSSINTHISTLQGRGVTVEFDDTTHLNVGEPRTVRMIYFVPNDRPYHADVEQRAKDHVHKSQIFFAEQMRAHRYGNKTFRVETDSKGEPMVHRVAGQYPNSHYFHYMQDKVLDEVGHTFDLNSNLYYIVLGTDGGFRRNNGQAGGGTGQRWGKVGGFVMVSDELDFGLTAHELGHAFGLSHDFRDGSYIMSYGPERNQLSACHAEYLSMNPYFNPDVPLEMKRPPTTELISPHTYPASAKSVPIRLKISDSDGLHQVILFAITSESHSAGRDFEVKTCRSLGGKKETIVEFDYDGVIPSDDSTNLSNSLVHELFVQAIDMKGNMVIERGVRPSFTLLADAPQPLTKISGDNQKGVSGIALRSPFVVEVRDENGAALAKTLVTFTVTAGGGTLNTTITTTDENGRAQTALTLGPNLGTNTVSVSAAGIQESVTFNATADSLSIEYLLSIPAGISLIHVPLKVTTVDGVSKTITSVADLYDALGGADNVNLLITHDPIMQRWHSYLGDMNRSTVADPVLTDDTGIIAVMNSTVSLRLGGDALGTNGSSSITLHPGINLVGVPLRDPRIARVTDLFTLEGIGRNVPFVIFPDNGALQTVGQSGAVIVLANGAFQTVGQVGDASDIPITGGQSFILNAREAATVTISGTAWYNFSEMVTNVPPLTTTGIEVEDTTPVLALRGSIIDQGTHVNKRGLSVTVKNLSTDKVTTTIIGDKNQFSPDKWESKEVEYQLTVVDAEIGRAAMTGDILEISVQAPESFIGAEPLQYTVTAEDVRQSRIHLPALMVYEILWETGLLQNYPNPFTPETWIPYRLAEDAFVTLTIYDLRGHVVRKFEVGQQIAAVYESESKAIYWNGRNDVGEQVASGIYFYTLIVGDFSATRKMLILK